MAKSQLVIHARFMFIESQTSFRPIAKPSREMNLGGVVCALARPSTKQENCKVVGWDQIAQPTMSTRCPQAHRPAFQPKMVGLRSLRDLVPPYDNRQIVTLQTSWACSGGP